MESEFGNLDKIEISFYHPSGVYFISIKDKYGVIGKKFVKL